MFPVSQTRTDLFSPNEYAIHYSIERYHITGSRILSRSFNVDLPEPNHHEQDSDDGQEDSDEQIAANTSIGSGMDVDVSSGIVEEAEEEEADDEESLEDDSSDTAMVPMADLLNARFECENVRGSVISRNLLVVNFPLGQIVL